MMGSTVIIGKVNEAARNPEVRKILFQRIEEPRNDLEAFEILYGLYSGDTFEKALYPQERKAMQKVLAEQARIAFLCPSMFPTDSESEKIRKVAECIFDFIDSPDIEYLDSFLTLLERKEIAYKARFAMARCLQKFLPGHADIFEFDSLKKRIVSAMVGENGIIFHMLDVLLCAVKEHYAKVQAESEPE